MYLSVVTMLIVAIIAFFARRHGVGQGNCYLSYATPAPPRAQEAAAELFVALARIVELGRASAGDSHVVRTLERAKTELGCAPPTYANYLAIYHGLSSTDVSMLAAADAYAEAGGQAQSGARHFKEMGWQLRHVVRTVHRLGAALEIE
jgi:hypothetical protein